MWGTDTWKGFDKVVTIIIVFAVIGVLSTIVGIAYGVNWFMSNVTITIK